MNHKETKLQEILEDLRQASWDIEKKMQSKDYVVAGYAKNILYAYVGEKEGFLGADLVPYTLHPIQFNEYGARNFFLHEGTYTNGLGYEIKLGVMLARDYYRAVYHHIETSIYIVSQLG